MILPDGLIGDDCLLSTLLLTDLENHFGGWDLQRVEVLEFAGPVISRLSLLAKLRLQYRRCKRYTIRHFQGVFLDYHVRTFGLDTLPKNAVDLYAHWRKVGLGPYVKLRGLQTPFNLYGAHVPLPDGVFGRRLMGVRPCPQRVRWSIRPAAGGEWPAEKGSPH